MCWCPDQIWRTHPHHMKQKMTCHNRTQLYSLQYKDFSIYWGDMTQSRGEKIQKLLIASSSTIKFIICMGPFIPHIRINQNNNASCKQSDQNKCSNSKFKMNAIWCAHAHPLKLSKRFSQEDSPHSFLLLVIYNHSATVLCSLSFLGTTSLTILK